MNIKCKKSPFEASSSSSSSAAAAAGATVYIC
jgi:hypothetical protein